MSLLLSRPTTRLVGCALALAVALAGIGVSPASATPKPKKRHHATASVRRAKTSSRSASRRAAASKPKRAAESGFADLPVIPSLVELPSLDQVLQPGPTPTQSFAALPVAPAPQAAIDGRPLAAFSASAERLLSSMVDRARSQLGTRYVFGGDDPDKGLDCSSFARFAMEALGIRLPRTAAQQARVGTAVPRDRKLLRPGDLLTFGRGAKVSHVGIYLGEGHFIHASVTSGRIIETTIERNGRLFRRWQGARRLIAENDAKSGSAQSEF